jgi:uncharacterized protein (DUF1684 family)
MSTRLAIVFLIFGALFISHADAQTPKMDPTYEKSFQKWKNDLVESRKRNWLSLAGLFWLKPGDNTFGTDPHNSIVFPKGPAEAGSFELNGTDVRLKLSPGTHASVEGKPIAATAKLDPDTSEHRTVVEMGSLRFYVIVRGQRIGIRLKDMESPAIKAYQGPKFYPLNSAYRITAKWVPSDGKKTVDVPNVLGDVDHTVINGTAEFEIDGKKCQLTDLGGDPKEGLSFIFADLTTKTETYPGGRFLDTEPVVNGTVVLDFNEAYSPPCSVTPYATCPLAPKENRLAVAIAAGEKFDRHSHR